MGLKSGSRDAGLDDSEETDGRQATAEAEETDDGDRGSNVTESEKPSTADAPSDGSPDASTGAEGGGRGPERRPTMDSIPYKLRREKVNEGREQVPFFLREEVVEAEDGLRESLEEVLGEDVYKSDYREAAMIVAQRNPDLVADVLREWGYDLESR